MIGATLPEHVRSIRISLYDSDWNSSSSWELKDSADTALIPGSLLTEGTYYLQLHPYAEEGYAVSEEGRGVEFSVVGELADAPAFTLDRDSVITGESFVLSFETDGALTDVVVRKTNTLGRTETSFYQVDPADKTLRLDAGSRAGEITFSVSAKIDGMWTGWSPETRVTVTQFVTPTYAFVGTVQVGQPAFVQVTAGGCEGCEHRVWVYLNGEYVDSFVTTETEFIVPAKDINVPGTLKLEISNNVNYETVTITADVLAPEGMEWSVSESSYQVLIHRYVGSSQEAVLPVEGSNRYISSFTVEGDCFNGTGVKTVTIPDAGKSINWSLDSYCFRGTEGVTLVVDSLMAHLYCYTDTFTGAKGLTIKGYAGSEAEKIAEQYGIPFVALSNTTGTPVVTVSENTVNVGEYVTVYVHLDDFESVNGNKVILYQNGEFDRMTTVYYSKTVTFDVASYKEGDFVYTAAFVSADGVSLFSEPVTVTVRYAGTLDGTEITLPEGNIYVRQPLTFSFRKVDNAERYTCYLHEKNGYDYAYAYYTVTGEEADIITLSFQASDLAAAGVYELSV